MRTVDPGPDFDSWRTQARASLAAGVPPHDVLWEAQAGFPFAEASPPPVEAVTLKVPSAFVELARHVACHRDPARWAVLYRLLWRIVKKGERHLLEIPSDPDLRRARELEKPVRREIHKMHAFVRFRSVEPRVPDRERFVAWFEPEHAVVALGAPFFRKRFANFDWSIFTPQGCAHWDGEELVFTEGLDRDPCDHPDALESAWRTYYRSIFNPARLKPKAMQAEMAKRYWKNLPEADLIEGLVRESATRTRGMIEAPPRAILREPSNPYLAQLRQMSAQPGLDAPPPEASIPEIAKLLECCRGCELWERGTHAVPGEGSAEARIVIIGEQPGDQEDLHGKPFIGPAGLVLNRCLEAAGIDRTETYVTNAVKHFKWSPRGKIRLHQKPDSFEVGACRPWLLAELAAIRPAAIVLLGATAATSLLRREVAVLTERGLVQAPEFAPRIVLTVHPSYLLRLRERAQREEEERLFIEDLKLARP